MRFVKNPFTGTMPGKADDTNESQWNSYQKAPKDGSASPAMEKLGDRNGAPAQSWENEPFGGA